MKQLRFAAPLLLTVALSSLACNKPEPCSDIPATKESDALGVVLDGGHLCKADSGVINVDYDKAVEGVDADYKSSLEGAGWKGEQVSSGRNGTTTYFEKGEQKLLIVTLKSDRNVTTAIIKHCMVVGAEDSNPVIQNCLQTIQKMADVMKKS